MNLLRLAAKYCCPRFSHLPMSRAFKGLVVMMGMGEELECSLKANRNPRSELLGKLPQMLVMLVMYK